MKKILWLTSWYPNKLEPLSGDFIERHAKAASILNNVTVIHIEKDGVNAQSYTEEVTQRKYKNYPNLTAITGYYRTHATGLRSFIQYIRFQKKLIRQFIRDNGKPDLVHVHISFKGGIGALYCKWRYGIRYVVSEQWTIFCPEAKPSLKNQSLPARKLIGLIFKQAAHTSAVSEYLAHSIADLYRIKLPVHIPNVVNPALFFLQPGKHDVFTFVHVSVLNFQKSPFDIIEAIRMARKKDDRFKVIIYGPHVREVAERIRFHRLENVIDYRSETSQDVLAAEVRRCHSLILYSRFETFGCVVVEALAAGLPVIVSDITVMHELVQQHVNGVFVPLEKPELLAEKMIEMKNDYALFNTKKIAVDAQHNYSYSRIGSDFARLYASLDS